jgi:hypothetical protein
LAADSEPGAVFFQEELFDKLFGSKHLPVAEIAHPASLGVKATQFAPRFNDRLDFFAAKSEPTS